MAALVRRLLLGLWVGALVSFAFLFAPTAFAHVGPTAPFAATIGACVRELVMVGDWIAISCAGITVVTRLESRRVAAAIVACLALAVLLGYVETAAIVPQMERTALLTPAYEALHRQSSAVYGSALLFVLVAFVLALRERRAA